MTTVTLHFDAAAIQECFAQLRRLGANMAPVMRSVSLELLSQTEENFEAEGRPGWPELAPSTKQQREKHGKWPGQILQVSGALARGVTTEHGPDFASIGVAGVPYGAIQQLGGKAGRGKKTSIPARPYLPMMDGKIQPEAEQAVMDVIELHIGRALSGT